ncbi:MAG: hypothetical protein JWO95_3279 [Verrucomicrobiales bacterium]|nr:hypothetical protein [Verrucomicrobiales bacterium]
MKPKKSGSSRPRATKPKAKAAKPEVKAKPAAAAKKRKPSASARSASPKPSPAVAKKTPKTKSEAPKKTRKTTLKIPPILLEGDAPSAPPISGPGQRYSLGPTPPTEHFAGMGESLPEAYGTKRLFITARDPHWVYATWDLTNEQLKEYNALAGEGHLQLRVFKNEISSEPLSQIHVHPESRNWFIPVPEAATKYLAELGYVDSRSQWVSISKSGATFTPPDTVAEDWSVRFATIPPDVPFEQLLALVKEAVMENVPLVEALQQLRADGFANLPKEVYGSWSPEQEQALASVISIDKMRRVWIGSLEITELVRRQLQGESSSWSGALVSLPSSMGASWTSPLGGGMEKRRSFWFNVNAELIIYGATEPDATVTIGDRKIKLRPDGTFSFRFCLPDGNFSLPAVATSADQEESREAALKFTRDTKYRGEVGAHPQDKKLKAPVVEAVT